LFLLVSRITSGHCAARSHLIRYRIVEEAMCECLKDYETVDHLIRHCERFETERRRLTDALTALDVELRTPVRDLCVMKKLHAMECCLDFFGNLGIRIFDDLAVCFQGLLEF
jgi:hypothetical protein